jgi:cyanate permease
MTDKSWRGPNPAATGAYRFLIEALLFLSYFVFGLSWIGYSPFLGEFQSRFALSHGQAGMLISSVSFAKIFVPFVAGALAVRLGIKRALLLGMACICASLLTPFASEYSLLLASRFVLGMGGAILVTLFGSAVLQWFPPEERPVVNGINGVAVNAGITLALFITVPLAQQFGRTEVLTGYALLSVALTLGWWALGRDRAAPAGAASSAAPAAGASYLDVLRDKATWYLTIGFAGPLSLYLVFNTWLPTFYKESLGLTLAQGSQLAGLANFVGIPAAVIGGILTKRTARRKPWIWGSGLVLCVSAFGLFLAKDLTVLTASAVVYGISIFLWVSPLVTLAMELPGMTPARLGMVMGVFFGGSYIVAFFAPIVTGMIRDATGSFLPGFVMFALSCWTLVAAGWLLPETGRRREAAGSG